ncbi:MAG TPA: DUF3883 domain-containing protein [Elusimicrobiota bacterium]|nr:DUF3883 domain-containing protein [Elusimicrobiota bacterium]
MTNKEIETKAVEFVIEYERKQGRTARAIKQGQGYDVESIGRKIEVKGVGKKSAGWRLMEMHHFRAIQKHMDYFVYLVEDIETTPCLYIIPRSDVTGLLEPRIAWTLVIPSGMKATWAAP